MAGAPQPKTNKGTSGRSRRIASVRIARPREHPLSLAFFARAASLCRMGTTDRSPTGGTDEPFRAIFDGALDAMLLADDEGRFVEANPAALALLGVTFDEIRRARAHDFTGLEGAANAAGWRAFLDAGMLEGTIQLRRPNGTTVDVEFRAIANVIPGRHLSVLRDLTARRTREEAERVLAESEAVKRALQSRLAIADRMASLGTLAAGLAHEINNPLAAVMGNLEYLTREIGALKASGHATALAGLDEPLVDARCAAERIREVVRDLKLFTRSDDERCKRVDVRRVLDSTLQMAFAEVRHRARLVKDYQTVPAAYGNDARLGQVFLNLVVNAARAIPEGDVENNVIRITTRTGDHGGAVIEVEDSGPGIAAEHLTRVFEPFFSTDDLGTGSGLGLSICQRIVHDMGGEIVVESDLGKGALFRVTLPRAPSEVAAPAAAAEVRAAAPRSGRILIVDDEPMILGAIVRSLGGAHDVTTLESAREALTRIEAGERYDVIVCDLMMPQMTGMDLHAELEARTPEMAERMVFMTGGVFTSRARTFLDTIPNQRLEKPFDTMHFRAMISDRLR
ncbi:MAG: response regulator [Labilithrix sp.]|nr:response regulator [Labilithrix sp.]